MKKLRIIKSSLICLALQLSSAHCRVIEKIVVIVNDQIITLSDLENYRKNLSDGGLVDEALLRLVDVKLLMKDRNALLNHMINEKILNAEVKRKNLEVTIERVEQEMRSITGRNNISRNQLKDALLQKGITISQYQDFIKRSLERQALIEREVSSKVKISDEDVSAYYLSKKGSSEAQFFEFSLSHILFLSSNGGDAAALARAKTTLEKLKTSISFEKLAEQSSEDPNFTQGGALGVFKAGEMQKELEQAVRGLNAGDTTGIVKTRAGYHIVKVNKKVLVSDPKLEAQKEEIRNTLYAEAFKKQFKSWLSQKRDEAFIRINGQG